MIVGFLLCLAGRICQIGACTDMTTGFIYYEIGALGGLCYYLPVALLFGLMFLTTALDKKKGGPIACEPSDIVDGRAVAMGFGMVLVGALAVYHGIEEKNAVSPIPFAMYADFILGGIIALTGFATLYFKEFKPWLGFAYASGACYFVLRGVLVFIERMVIVSVPEYLIECLCLIGMSVFFMMLAKYLSGNEDKRTRQALCIVGVPTAVMALSSSLATIICDFVMPEDISSRIVSSQYQAEFFYQASYGRKAYMLSYTPWTITAAGLFIAVTLVVLFTAQKQESSQTEENSSN